MLTKRVFLSTVATCGAAVGFGLPAHSRALANDYPSRAIHFIQPFPAGPGDLVARLYAQRISQDWHEPAVIDTRQGATGSIGTEVVVKAKAFCGPISQALPFLKSGQVYALGVSGSKPSPLLPQVAPLSAAYPGLVITPWFGVLAPAHTPEAICHKLAAEMKKIYDDPEVKQKLLSVGLEPNWIPGPELTQRIAADLKKWHDLMTVAGIHAG